MKENDKKFYKLSEEEQQKKLEEIKRKNKGFLKKMGLGAFCVIVILLLVFGLLAGMFSGNNTDNSSSQTIISFFL